MILFLNIDGAARGNPGPAGYGIAVSNEDGEILHEAYGYLGEQTNNIAEYCALIAALELASYKKWQDIRIRSDSQLMVRQLNGEYKVKNPRLKELFSTARRFIRTFNSFSIEHVRRENNKEADSLANQAVDSQESSPHFINPVLAKPISRGENLRMEF